MTVIRIELPDDLARRAQSQGLLSDQAMQHLLEEAMRRTAGKRLLDTMRQLREVSGEPMPMEEITAVVKQVRAERDASGT